MARMFKVLPEIESEFNTLGFTMALLLISMCMSMFDYHSLLRSVIILYTTYICLMFRENIYKYCKKQIRTFRPVMAPYQSGTDDDEGYEEDDDKDDGIKDVTHVGYGGGEEKTTSSDLRQRTILTSTI